MSMCVCVCPGYCANFTQFSAFYAKFCRCKFTQIYAIKSFFPHWLSEEYREGAEGCVGVCRPHVGVNWQHINFQAHTHAHTHQLHILSVRQTETFYASAPQIFFGIKYLSCTVVV